MSNPRKTLRIGVVAGEASGDILGAGLIQALRRRYPDIRFEGIGGARMKAAGCRSLFPMERLSVMGLVEVLGRYRELRAMRAQLIEHFRRDPPDLYIGIDAPDFNLGLAAALKQAGIPTMQYVSPQVWAWRRYRVRAMRKALDHILVLFPFEQDFYREHGIPATFVGHPLADELHGQPDTVALRRSLRLPEDKTLVAMLPGSRVSELKAHADLFVKTAMWLDRHGPGCHFVVPFINRETRLIFEAAIRDNQAWDLPLTRMHGHSREAMTVSDAVLLASGTAALEAMLLRRPMVVTYRLSWLSYHLVRWFTSVQHVSLPNNLAGRALVPELIQSQATPENLGRALLAELSRPEERRVMLEAFDDIAATLRCQANERAAEAVLKLLAVDV